MKPSLSIDLAFLDDPCSKIMAEDGHWERKAKRRCETEAIKLAAPADYVTDLTFVRSGEQGHEPVAAQCYLAWKIYDLRKAWSSYEASHNFLLKLWPRSRWRTFLGPFRFSWATTSRHLARERGSAALMDKGPAANEAQDPSKEVPTDAENEDPDVIMKVEVPVNADPAAPASPAPPEVDTLAEMDQGALHHRSQQLYQHY